MELSDAVQDISSIAYKGTTHVQKEKELSAVGEAYKRKGSYALHHYITLIAIGLN